MGTRTLSCTNSVLFEFCEKKELGRGRRGRRWDLNDLSWEHWRQVGSKSKHSSATCGTDVGPKGELQRKMFSIMLLIPMACKILPKFHLENLQLWKTLPNVNGNI